MPDRARSVTVGVAEVISDNDSYGAINRIVSHNSSTNTNPMRLPTAEGGFSKWRVDTTRSLASAQVQVSGHVPWGLVTAVVIDCAVDGMLIGLTSSRPGSAGLLLAMASSIESAFLGLSFSASL